MTDPRLVEVIRDHLEHDFTPHRTDRPLIPDRDTYIGQAITARAERLAEVIEKAGYHR